ncbi:MAG: hypothetical protein WCY98_04580 [Castellaniella sp.]
MKRILFFDNSPSLSATLRFFLNVPLFLVLAAVLLATSGPQALASRWTPAALALTHLVTLGVMASAMIGALLQILPVTTSIRVWRTRLTGIVVHAALTAGTLALATAFLWQSQWAARLAWVLLGLAFAWILFAVALGMWLDRERRTQGSEALLSHVQLALVSLVLTVLMGLAMLGVRAWGSRLGIPALTDIHGAWGLLGWLGLLLAGVTFKVIPVFQGTELYPKRVMQWLGGIVFSLLALWTIVRVLDLPGTALLADAAGMLLGAAWAGYAVASMRLLSRRKRTAADTTTRFWWAAMTCFALCLPVWLWYRISLDGRVAVLLGLLPTMGVAVSAINGMLYKILPVLLWNHTQMPLQEPLPQVPKLKTILPDHLGTGQFHAHLVALIVLALACLWPALRLPAAGLTLVSALWLTRNIAYALGIYRRAQREIAVALAEQAAIDSTAAKP